MGKMITNILIGNRVLVGFIVLVLVGLFILMVGHVQSS